MSTLTAGREQNEVAYEYTRAVMANVPDGATREAVVEAEALSLEAWRAADPEGAAELDDAMGAAEGFAGRGGPVRPRPGAGGPGCGPGRADARTGAGGGLMDSTHAEEVVIVDGALRADLEARAAEPAAEAEAEAG